MGVSDAIYNLKCACERVQYKVQGEPAFQVYCHCADCRKWYQQTPVGIVIFPEDAFTELEGGENVAKHNVKDPYMDRTFCKRCGYRLYNQHRGFAFRGTPALSLEGFKFEPQAHVFCKDAGPEELARFKADGLSKFADQPPISGGTGKKVEL